MSDEASALLAGWIVEVFGDGTGARHRRYIVGAIDRATAIEIARQKLGSEMTITSTSKVAGTALDVMPVKHGDIVPI